MKTALLFATTALFALLLATSCCQAFSVSKPSSASARPDASSAVEEALKITAAFGINSEEARVAWDIVEGTVLCLLIDVDRRYYLTLLVFCCLNLSLFLTSRSLSLVARSVTAFL